ncbi:hypothetical protein Ddye_021184 [Dipteronia dyeriana]|uniref:Cytokinin riboside 5'-monophosphate phosphoribohydrolase n=1 Tax=Dipteronia dyeriana TaxID=168575 RepID=A0AAD9WW33_9ROSI|nr:hypothetical protein Ddye_021184 [Dipteronia dyeriana]
MASPSTKRFTNICVFGDTNYRKYREFVEAATHLGKVLAEQKIHLVYGGGNLGLMGCVSPVTRDGGSQILGIVPKPMAAADIIGKTNGEVLVEFGMPERLTAMLHHADAFIAMPGGFGTLEEIFTMASWAQLHIHEKLIGLLNVNKFYDEVIQSIQNYGEVRWQNKHRFQV